MSVNKDVIDRIRASFLTAAQENSDLYDACDVDRVQSQDWPIERFVLVTKSEETALKALIKAMQWRKTFGVNHFTDDYFPEELYKIGYYSTFSKDKEGRNVLWIQTRVYHKSAELTQLIKQYIVYQYEKIDRQTTHQGWDMVMDMTDTGLSNVDMDLSNYLVDVLQSYYPRGLKHNIVVDMPWILNAVSKLITAFMNEEFKNTVKYIKRSELVQYINSEYIPVHLNGTFGKVPIVVPNGVKPLEQLSHTKFTSDQIKKIYSTLKLE